MNNIKLNFQIPNSTTTEWSTNLDRIIEDSHSNPNFNVPKMARKMGLSERNLFYKLKQETNQTPSNYLKNYRLEKAYELLSAKRCKSISDVCYQTGFNNVHHFSRQFRMYFNCTPLVLLKH